MPSLKQNTFRESLSMLAGIAAGLIFAALVFAAPWAYGGVEHWFRAWLAAALAIASGFAAIRALTVVPAVSMKLLLLAIAPLVGLLGLGLVQWWGGIAPPVAVRVATPDTIYPAATRLAIAGVLAASAAVLLGGIIFSRGPAFELLLAACLVSSVVVGFLGIAMHLTGDDRLINGMAFAGDPFANFVNRNNACAFLTAGMAAGLALLRATPRFDEEHRSHGFSDRNGWRIDRTTRLVVLVTLLAICLAGVIASRSRGGTLAAFVTLATGAAFFRGEGWTRRLLLFGPVVATAVALVVWVGLSDAAFQRFQGMSVASVFREGRIPHWRDAMNAVQARPIFGAGLGTYGYAYQEFSSVSQPQWYEHADNQFVETLVEGGAVGATAVFAVLVLALVAVVRGGEQPAASALVASLVAGQGVHAIFDFGIIIPAVSIVVAALWGAGIVRSLSVSDAVRVPRFTWIGRSAVATLCIAVAVSLLWAFREHSSAAAVERFAGFASRVDRPGGLEADEVDRAIVGLSNALERRPDDAFGQRELARLYLYRYRTLAMVAMKNVDATLTRQAAWRATGISSLHREVCLLYSAGAVAGIDGLARNPIVRRDLVPAREHMLAAKAACSRIPGVHLSLAALAFLGPNRDPRGLEELVNVLQLFPADESMLRTAGQMAWQAGDSTLASRCWKASFTVSRDGFGEFMRALADEAGATTAVELAVPDDLATAVSLIVDPKNSIDVSLRQPLGAKLRELARGLPEGPLRQRVSANIDWLEGRHEAATRQFHELIAMDPLNADLRLNFAVACRSTGHEREAMDELDAAIALHPERTDLQGLARNWRASARLPARLRKSPSSP
jgi:O-antigen ligase